MISRGSLRGGRRRTLILAGAWSLATALALGVAWTIDPPPASLTNTDFANYWVGSSLVLAGNLADLFGPQPVYFSHLQAAFGPDYPWHAWSYPPTWLLVGWPLALLPFVPSMVLWQSATLAAYLWAVRRLTGDLGLTTIVFVFPFILFNLVTGQNGLLTGALLVGAVAVRESRPLTSGGLLSGLVVKPHLAVLAPLLLLAERRIRVVVAATVGVAVLVGVSVVAFGWDAWSGYIVSVLPHQTRVMTEGTGSFLAMMPGTFGALRLLGVGWQAALAAHLVVALPVVVVSTLVWVRNRGGEQSTLVFLLATPIVVPYAFLYDLGGAAAAAVVLRRRSTPASTAVAASLALLPLAGFVLGTMSLPLGPVVLLAAWGLSLRDGRADQTTG